MRAALPGVLTIFLMSEADDLADGSPRPARHRRTPALSAMPTAETAIAPTPG